MLNETFDSGNRTICLLSTNERISTFAGLLAGTILLNFIKIVLFSSMCVNASRVLHNQMLDCILHTPMLFFDTNPIGIHFLKGFLLSACMCNVLLGMLHTSFSAALVTSKLTCSNAYLDYLYRKDSEQIF